MNKYKLGTDCGQGLAQVAGTVELLGTQELRKLKYPCRMGGVHMLEQCQVAARGVPCARI